MGNNLKNMENNVYPLLIEILQEVHLNDTQLVALLLAVLGLEEVEFAGRRFHHFHDLSEGIAVGGSTLELYRDLTRANGTGLQMYVSERTVGIAAPYKFLPGIYLERV